MKTLFSLLFFLFSCNGFSQSDNGTHILVKQDSGLVATIANKTGGTISKIDLLLADTLELPYNKNFKIRNFRVTVYHKQQCDSTGKKEYMPIFVSTSNKLTQEMKKAIRASVFGEVCSLLFVNFSEINCVSDQGVSCKAKDLIFQIVKPQYK